MNDPRAWDGWKVREIPAPAPAISIYYLRGGGWWVGGLNRVVRLPDACGPIHRRVGRFRQIRGILRGGGRRSSLAVCGATADRWGWGWGWDDVFKR